jgi:hypothetical protein
MIASYNFAANATVMTADDRMTKTLLDTFMFGGNRGVALSQSKPHIVGRGWSASGRGAENICSHRVFGV